jgi:predicted nucleotidyltransferase
MVNIQNYKNKHNILKPKEKVLKYLIENKTPQSILNISGAVVLDYKNTYNIINDFYPDIIYKDKFGNTNLIEIKLNPNQEIYSVEEKRTYDFLSKNPKLKILKNYIKEVNYPFFIVLIFGSYVKNTKTENSDIDICIISDDLEKSRELQDKFELVSLKLEIHTFTTKEFILMIDKSQNNLGKEIIKNNILLYGIENYYNLISKWMKKE